MITEDRVRTVYEACSRPEGTPDCAEVDGCFAHHTLVRAGLAEHEEAIVEMLCSVHPGFRAENGAGGAMFELRHRQCELVGTGLIEWTREPPMLEALVALGLASGYAEFCSPRETWSQLPGGLPYVVLRLPHQKRRTLQ